MKVGLFTKRFLEPTHLAIGQVVAGMTEHDFLVFAKGFGAVPGLTIANATPVLPPSSHSWDKAGLQDCDLIHAIYDGHIAFRACEISRELGIPFVLTFHGGFDTNAALRKPRFRQLTRTMAEQSAAITVVGPSDLRRLRDLGVRGKIAVLPVPVDFAALPTGLAPCPGKLVSIGRLIPKKGIDTAIEALALLPPHFKLEVIGSGPEDKRLRALASNLGIEDRVTFVGFLPFRQMLRSLATATVLLHTARHAEDNNADGTPQVILWAHALGIPTVGADSGSISDIIIDGLTGKLVRPNDPAHAAAAVEEFTEFSDSRDRIISIARSRARQIHDLPVILNAWRELYLKALSQKIPTQTAARSKRELVKPGVNRFREAFDAARDFLAPSSDCSLVNSGGQGVIFMVRSLRFGLVALKVGSFAGDDPLHIQRVASRINKEGDILTELSRRNVSSTPKIVALDSSGRFLIREFIPGLTLQDTVHSLTPESRVRLLRRLFVTCSNLFPYFHLRYEPYIIRDLKPANLIVATDASRGIVLVDLGSARPVNHARPKDKITKIRLGTRNWLYWPPELLCSHGLHADVSCDIFSLGATAFFLLTGRAPYSNAVSDPASCMKAYQEEYEIVRRQTRQACRDLGVPLAASRWIEKSLDPLSANRPVTTKVLD